MTSAPTDLILGDTFLRNAYTLFNFGTWARADAVSPYMQVISVSLIAFFLIQLDRC